MREQAYRKIDLLQFDGGIGNISRNFDQIFIFTIDHAIEAGAWIRTDRNIADVFDVIGI